ncbi:PD-(D/E)XK nuclease family protein, partial [Candidatus Pacearchaeota archaeon]|nr:PD-(D/E)XK nuclease family protein [Candidatus Pacearchaeota archaeon]
MVFKNEFSWSKSKDSCFKECPRKYYFNHYGSWNGWIAAEEDRTKRIYYLKQLKNKEIWVGQRVHETIEYILRQFRIGNKITLGHAIATLRKRFDEDFMQSSLREYTGFRSKAHKFFEDEYGIEINDEEKVSLFKKAELCLTNFFNSDIFMEIRRTPVEDWITLEDFLSFDFEGNKIGLSIDFAMKKEGKIILYDWKTGRERLADFDLQLTCYALYLAQKFNISPENIEARIFNIAIDKQDIFEINVEKLDEIKNYIRTSIKEMKDLLEDVNENTAKEEDFEKKEGFYCARCNFRKICLEGWGDNPEPKTNPKSAS